MSINTLSKEVKVMSKNNLSLAITPSVKLRPGQAKLYEFIVSKHSADGTISLPDVIEQYTAYGNRNVIDGKPSYYAYDWSEQRSYLAPLKDDEVKLYAVQWFIRNLGIFVVKGLLTAIPTMDLADIQVEAQS